MPETGLVSSLAKNRTVFRSFVCKVTSGESAGQKLALGQRPILVGTGRDCDLLLSDVKVSRHHAELQVKPEGLAVRDLGSTNGTFVDAVRVTEALVPLGASIRCGDSQLQVSGAVAPSLAPSARSRFGGLVGDSFAMRELFAILELASPTDTTVLIQGESGTGKELVARSIHDHSKRASKPFVVVDCSAIPEQLAESQLFGHVRGSFTGAVSDRLGAFIEADGGTLFLDELGELPLKSQAKLLRAIEQQIVQPVGSNRSAQVNVRVLAATNRDLQAMVKAQAFRFDLFHRLAVIHVVVPPLRERPDDLAPLIEHFYEGRGVEAGPVEGDNLELLRAHAWPGNVRELRNVIDRGWVLSGEAPRLFAKLPLWLQPSQDAPFEVVDTALPFKEAKERWNQSFERRYIASVFSKHSENMSKAAEHAGISRNHFRTLVERYGLKRR